MAHDERAWGVGLVKIVDMNANKLTTKEVGRGTGLGLAVCLIMPGMSGKQLVEHLAGDRPNTRVLYLSGYTENTIVHRGILEPGVAFLAKPFTPLDMVSKVRAALDHSGP